MGEAAALHEGRVMSAFEGSYKSLIQGVSQQSPELRLPGQVTESVNMLSDPVTGLRRRPGLEVKQNITWSGAQEGRFRAWFTDIAGQRVHLMLNTATGNLKVLNEQFVEQAEFTNSYLINADSTRIRGASVGNEFFLCNVDQIPVVAPESEVLQNPAHAGFFYIAAGAFSRAFTITFGYNNGTINATYTTPDGTTAGDAALATPEYIANQLYTQVLTQAFTDVRITAVASTGTITGLQLQENTGTDLAPVWTNRTPSFDITAAQIVQKHLRVQYTSATGAAITFSYQYKVNGTWVTASTYTSTPYKLPDSGTSTSALVPLLPFLQGSTVPYVAIDGPYVYLYKQDGLTVQSPTGSNFVVASKGGQVSSLSFLPARLPAQADGLIIKVGVGSGPSYFKYNAANTEWVESAVYGSPGNISNAPISVFWTGTAWALDTTPFTKRNAGDDDSNPKHDWMQYGISGMGTYQGRLILMSGPLVSMSSSKDPRVFFRTTVEALLASDPVEIGSGMNTSAAYEWAVPFQKDLILFSASYQALIPSGNSAITPANATVVPTSNHEVDTKASPVSAGRTLLYASPKSSAYFGVLEMLPSQYTDSQYVSIDSTAHLPKYMRGRCRFSASSSVADTLVFGTTGDSTELIVHEYYWDAETKQQQSWHRWQFPYPVEFAYFASDVLVVVFIRNGIVIISTMDPRESELNAGNTVKARLDFRVSANLVNGSLTIPAWFSTFDASLRQKLVVASIEAGLTQPKIGGSFTGDVFEAVPGWEDQPVEIGVPYVSSVVPTPPAVSDRTENVIYTGKYTVLRYNVVCNKDANFTAYVSDRNTPPDDVDSPSTAMLASEFRSVRPMYEDDSVVLLPARVDARTARLKLETSELNDMNITALEYVGRFNARYQRR